MTEDEFLNKALEDEIIKLYVDDSSSTVLYLIKQYCHEAFLHQFMLIHPLMHVISSKCKSMSVEDLLSYQKELFTERYIYERKNLN